MKDTQTVKDTAYKRLKTEFFVGVAISLCLWQLWCTVTQNEEGLAPRWVSAVIVAATLSYPFINKYTKISERAADAFCFGLLLASTIGWIKSQQGVTTLDAFNQTWLRASFPAIMLLIATDSIGIIYHCLVLALLVYGVVESESPSKYTILFDFLAFSLFAHLHGRYTQQTLSTAISAGETAEKANEKKTVFIAKMSHDLRTPLNGLLGFLDEMLEMDMAADQHDILRVVHLCAKNLERLIVDMLDVSMIEMGQIKMISQPFKLYQDLEYLSVLAKGMAENAGKSLQFHIDPRLPKMASGDSVRFQQVLINLINNAIKFTPKSQGNIQVEITLGPEVDSSQVPIEYSVKDNGCGIPPAAVSQLFTPFFQCKSEHMSMGSGLGLYICRQLVTAMQGNIAYSSVDGMQGSCFSGRVLLERTIETPTEAPKTLSRSENVTVLIAEDNPVNMKLISRILDGLGIRYITATDGYQAIHLYNQNKERLAAILMDVQMPHLDGIEATKVIRKMESEHPGMRVPIIAVTARVMSNELEAVMECGMDHHISKPIKKADLWNILQICTHAKST